MTHDSQVNFNSHDDNQAFFKKLKITIFILKIKIRGIIHNISFYSQLL